MKSKVEYTFFSFFYFHVILTLGDDMAKYCFKVYLNDGSSKKVSPSILGTNVELSDMDKFAYKCGSTFELHKILAEELGINLSEINKISIFQLKTELDFSIIINNPYLTSVLTSVERKKIKGYQNYELDTIVVPKDNTNYLEMENYLFKNIEENCRLFLTDIYKYNNEFARLLYRYGTTYNKELYSEEESRNIQELKNKIKLGLSIYKNYRGICKSRYEYETKRNYSKTTTPPKKETQYYKQPEEKEKDFPQIPLYQFNQYTNYLGEEKEEFLDIDERDSENNYEKRR